MFLCRLSIWLKLMLRTLKITSDRGLVQLLFVTTMNLAPIGVLCIFGNQYIMEKVLSCSVILRSHFLQYLMLFLIVFNNFLLRL